MPSDEDRPHDDDIKARLRRIRADLAYFKAASATQGVGHQPATIYAAKYAEDVEFLLQLAQPGAEAVPTPPPSELETALAHDAAGRAERKNR